MLPGIMFSPSDTSSCQEKNGCNSKTCLYEVVAGHKLRFFDLELGFDCCTFPCGWFDDQLDQKGMIKTLSGWSLRSRALKHTHWRTVQWCLSQLAMAFSEPARSCGPVILLAYSVICFLCAAYWQLMDGLSSLQRVDYFKPINGWLVRLCLIWSTYGFI
jgi:hypothetical protein